MLRLWVTEGCNASCPFCMNANARKSASVSYEKTLRLFQYFRNNGFDKVALMGGEPTIHKDIVRITTSAINLFDCVYFFTNGLNVELLDTIPFRDSDIIIYNSHFLQYFNEKTLLLNSKGERVLDIVVDDKTDVKEMAQKVNRIMDMGGERIKANIVLNNSINIFNKKRQITENVNQLFDILFDKHKELVEFQCSAPLCFTYGEKLPPFKQNTICPNEAILVDGNYNALFCNIHTDKIINLFNDDDSIIPYKILLNHIKMYAMETKLKSLKKICKDCLFWEKNCNGKCYISQDILDVSTITKNTKLPWLIQ